MIKANVIYIKGYGPSEIQMQKLKKSLDTFNISYDLIEGITPKTLSNYIINYPLNPVINSRAHSYEKEKNPILNNKKSCFINHIMFWERVITSNTPMMFLEHDSLMVRKWNNTTFDEVLVMNLNSAVSHNKNLLKHIKKSYVYNNDADNYKNHTLDYKLKYWNKNLFEGGSCAPGTAAYAITPKGAKRLLESYKKNGWDQSDFFINTNNVNIQYSDPDFFEFSGKNLKSSHGF